MRIASKICLIAALVLWVLGLGVLLLTALGTALIPEGFTYVSAIAQEGRQWILPAWIAATALIGVGMILCLAFKKREGLSLLPLLMAAIGAVVALVVALALKNALPEKVGVQYESQGLTAWRLIWRHFSPVAAGALTAIAALMNKLAARDDRIRAENDAYKEHYDLSGEPLFADESTIGLETYAREVQDNRPPHKLKKSLRRKQQ